MTLPETDRPEAERGSALAWSLTTVGGALFLLGFLRLLNGYTAAVFPHFGCSGVGTPSDPTPALLSLRLAGWFAVSGWMIPYFPLLRAWGRRACSALRHWSRGPSDGILEILLCGLFFIVALLVVMVSFWSRTIR